MSESFRIPAIAEASQQPAVLSLLVDPPDPAEVGAACDLLREAGMDRMADAIALALRRPRPEPTDDYRRAALAALPPIFALCLGSDGGRFTLANPFREGDHVYATDARIAARVPVPAGWDLVNPEGSYPKIGERFAAVDPGGYLDATIPEVGPPCPLCGGCGVASPAYSECPDCGQDRPRDWRACDACWGSGVEGPGNPIELLPRYTIGRGFAAILRRFGASARVPKSGVPSGGKGQSPMRFSCGEAEGLLMPIDYQNRNWGTLS
jgi:hypothetical protein